MNLPNKPDEIHALLTQTAALVDELHAKAKADADKAASEKWTKSAGVSLVVIAVLAATAVQKGGSYGSKAAQHTNQSIFLEVKAADQWAFYQSKSTKAHMFLLGAELVEHLGPNGDEEARMIASIMKKQKQYEADKEDVRKDAEKLEKQRDDERELAAIAAEAGSKLGRSVTAFQMSIAVASVGLVIKKKSLWFISLLLGLAATGWMVWCLLHAPAR
jgi:Domain of unknown function (DUF4337)